MKVDARARDKSGLDFHFSLSLSLSLFLSLYFTHLITELHVSCWATGCGAGNSRVRARLYGSDSTANFRFSSTVFHARLVKFKAGASPSRTAHFRFLLRKYPRR